MEEYHKSWVEAMQAYYESYKEEFRYECGDNAVPMSFERYCDFYEITEKTPIETIYEIFAF